MALKKEMKADGDFWIVLQYLNEGEWEKRKIGQILDRHEKEVMD